jgi:dihydroorotase
MEAAVAGGVTSLACPPDTDPPLDEPGLVEMLRYRARNLNRARVHPIGALTAGLAGERLTEMGELRDSGCVAFGQANRPIQDTQVLLRALQYAATFDYPVWLFAQDPYLARGGVAHEGEVAGRLGLEGIPPSAETVRVATLLQLAACTGVRLHITRVSTAAGVAMIDEAPSATATPCAAHLPAVRSMRSAQITRRWTTTPSRYRSPRPSPARPAWNCCSRSR